MTGGNLAGKACGLRFIVVVGRIFSSDRLPCRVLDCEAFRHLDEKTNLEERNPEYECFRDTGKRWMSQKKRRWKMRPNRKKNGLIQQDFLLILKFNNKRCASHIEIWHCALHIINEHVQAESVTMSIKQSTHQTHFEIVDRNVKNIFEFFYFIPEFSFYCSSRQKSV